METVKPLWYFNVFIQRVDEAVTRCGTADSVIVARYLGMEHQVYIRTMTELAALF